MEKNVEGKRSLATLELLKIAEENPGLPIIAEMYSEVTGNENYISCFGEVTGACIEYVLTVRTFGGMYRTWTLDEALVENHFFIEENAPESLKQKLYKLSDADFNKEACKWIKSLPWDKCIIVYVCVPGGISPESEIESKGAKDE